ncbi:MAG: DUF4760 domain-containing protein [Candidatus Promineifilaceae bacterium]|jgi:hypothetical protein
MSDATYEDAQILLQTAQWWTMAGVNEVMNWLWSDEFEPDYEAFVEKYPIGSDKFGEVNKVLGAFETVGALWRNGLFNEKLLFDWMAVGMIWDRVSGIALGIREAAENARLYEHFEAMAAAAENY